MKEKPWVEIRIIGKRVEKMESVKFGRALFEGWMVRRLLGVIREEIECQMECEKKKKGSLHWTVYLIERRVPK